MSGSPPRTPLIGRAAPLAALQSALDAAGDAAQVVVVEGEGGIGKTALLEEFAARFVADDVTFIRGGAVDVGGEAIPYAPVTELLRDIRRQHGLVADLGVRAAKDRAEFFDRVLDVLDMTQARASRVALVIEDLHWADEATIELIAFLARNLTPGFLLILTQRPEEPGERTRALLAAVARGRGRRITLDRLDRDQVRAVVESARGDALDERRLDAIYQRGEGNPFLTTELAASDDDAVPASVRDVVLARTQDLDERAWAVAGLAAVTGERIPHDVLCHAGVGFDGLDDAIARLVRSGLLIADSDGYAFRHALTREVLLERQLPAERRRWHAAAARALATHPRAEADAGIATEIATHWHLARCAEEACDAAIAAARLCTSVFAFDEAWRQYQRALDWRRNLDSDLVLLTAAAEAARWAGATSRASELAQRALELADNPTERARLHERLGHYLWDAGRTDDARASFAAASRELRDLRESPLSATVAASLAHLHLMSGDGLMARELSQAAIDTAIRVTEPAAEGRARITYGLSLCFLGDLAAGVADVRRGHALAMRWCDLDERRRADSNLSYALLMAGETGAACEISLGSLAALRRHGLDAAAGAALTSNTIVLLRLTGRWDEADRLAQEALASAIPLGQARYVHLARAELAIARGDFNLAREQLDRASAQSSEQAQQTLAADLSLAEAELALADNDLEGARERVRRVADALPATAADRLTLQVTALGLRVEADIAALQRRPTGTTAIAMYETMLDRVGEPAAPENRALRALGGAELHRARLANDSRLWDAATQQWEAIDHPRETAYCLLRLAEALLATGGPARLAGEALRASHRRSVTLGARPLAGAAEALARRARIRLDDVNPFVPVPPRPRSAEFGLTPREVDVLRALAGGDTNRDIARALFLSPRTVGVHVSNILAKLGVATRGQAAALATRLGLLADTHLPSGAGKGH